MAAEKADRYKRNHVIYAALAAVLLCLMLLAGCAAKSGAEKKVARELDSLKSSNQTGSEILDMEESLSDEEREHFEGFLSKLRDFDYEIISSEESDDPDDDYTTVTVRIKTYDFGREYLAVWTEYLRTHEGALESDAELTDFYGLLFKSLDGLQEKEYIKYIDIICIDPLDNGEWIANIKENEELQDAIFGGMLSEMKTLAAE